MLFNIDQWAASLAQSQAPEAALFLISFSESVFFPVPPDFLLIPLCLLNPENSFLLALNCTVASTCGGAAGHLLGRLFGKKLLLKFTSEARFCQVQKIFSEYGLLGVGIAGFTPIPYKVFTISAGIFAVPFIPFCIVSFFSRGARFFIVGASIYFFGEHARKFLSENFELVSIGAGLILICLVILLKFYKSCKGK